MRDMDVSKPDGAGILFNHAAIMENMNTRNQAFSSGTKAFKQVVYFACFRLNSLVFAWRWRRRVKSVIRKGHRMCGNASKRRFWCVAVPPYFAFIRLFYGRAEARWAGRAFEAKKQRNRRLPPPSAAWRWRWRQKVFGRKQHAAKEVRPNPINGQLWTVHSGAAMAKSISKSRTCLGFLGLTEARRVLCLRKRLFD